MEMVCLPTQMLDLSGKCKQIWMFPENRGTPKWMVYSEKTLLKWNDLGVIFGNIHMAQVLKSSKI